MSALTDQQMTNFWPKVIKADKCWEWTGAKDRNGYGIWTPPKASGLRMAVAHRFSYENALGEVPAGLELDHLCRNKSCVNPSHLEPVTHAENMRRAFAHRTHCAQGHERNSDNWVRKASGRHYCRACSRETARRTNGYRARIAS